MDLNELKLISASNIIKLRTEAGLTQAELGAKLNYSDKTISKWERGEAIPDAFVLKQMSAMFGVSVDALLSAQDEWKPPEVQKKDSEPKYSADVIIAIVILSIMTVDLIAFIALWIMHIIEWCVFLVGIIISLLAYMILDCVFKKARHLPYSLSAFIASVFAGIYFIFPDKHMWQIFILIIPAVVIVVLSCNIRRRPHKKAEDSAENQ